LDNETAEAKVQEWKRNPRQKRNQIKSPAELTDKSYSVHTENNTVQYCMKTNKENFSAKFFIDNS
jgi:hypothetical protein